MESYLRKCITIIIVYLIDDDEQRRILAIIQIPAHVKPSNRWVH